MNLNYIIVGSDGEIRYKPSKEPADYGVEVFIEGNGLDAVEHPPVWDEVTGEIVQRLTPAEVPVAVGMGTGYAVFTWAAEGFTRRDLVTFVVLEDDPYPVTTVNLDILREQVNAELRTCIRLAHDIEREFMNVTHHLAIPAEAEPLLRKMAVAAANQIGTEGLSAESYSGVSQTFLDDLDKRTLRELYSFRRVRW